MLKNYFSVRVYVIVDACLLAVWLVSGINGWSEFAKYPYVAAIVWCGLTIPLAAIGLITVYQRLHLHHRKNVHTQYEYEQQTEIRLAEMRQQYSLSPPPLTIHQQNSILSNQPVALSGQLADGRTDVNGQVIDEATDREADKRKVLFYVQQYPKSGYREIGKAVGFGRTKVGELINELKQEGQL